MNDDSDTDKKLCGSVKEDTALKNCINNNTNTV